MTVLNVHRFGPDDGLPLLAIHGVTGHGARFRRLAVEALPTRAVLAPDLRGHGLSSWEPPWSLESHEDDLIELLDNRELERIDVMGHSFGGLLSVRLAARAPERVGDVLLIDPAIAIPPALSAEEAEATRYDEGWASEEEARAARAEQRPESGLDSVDPDLADHLARSEDGRYRFRFSRPAVITAWGELARDQPPLDGFEGRLRLVTALQAPYVRDLNRDAFARDLGARFDEVQIDAGHMLYWDALPETRDAVAGFFSA